MGTVAFNHGKYAEALTLFEAAMQPPVSLGVDTFVFRASPQMQYYLGRTLEALGKKTEPKAAYEKGLEGIEQLSGDRDSWNSENFYMVLSLDRLGRADEAKKLIKHFQDFAETEKDSNNSLHRAEARFLLGLVRKHDGQTAEARKLMEEAVQAKPDLLAARYELRGDSLDPLPK
jgi:tetratricopeptide (TPR) repeat protein